MKHPAVVLVVLVAAGSANAAEFRFRYSSEDLLSPAAVAALHDRLRSNAEGYCRDRYDKPLGLVMQCSRSLVKDVIEQIDHAQLTAHHQDGEASLGS